MKEAQTIFEKSQPAQHAYSLPKDSPDWLHFQPDPRLVRQSDIPLPEISEIDLTRHFCSLASKNAGIDTCFYPLGSCTMKFNPRINEYAASLPNFVKTHPLAPDHTVQGNLRIIYELIELLCEITGMASGSLLPIAGAQGEFTGLKMIKAYHRSINEEKRTQIIIPDSAHGTNPASAVLAGYEVISVRSNSAGSIDLSHLKSVLSDKTAGLMLTNPSTLGLFIPSILEIADLVHRQGGLLYYDGANLNPILQLISPAEMGFDVMHINLHKTFSTPHGGGGPGSGPVLCNQLLKPFLPLPWVEKQNCFSTIWEDSSSIGKVCAFHGNFSIYLRAYLYIKLHGKFGLRRIAEAATLNANYLKHHLSNYFTIPYSQPCMHEFVVQADNYLQQGIRAIDIAKRLLDYGMHAPTIYFPLIVKECMLIEPTESESKLTLDRFVHVIDQIVQEININPGIVKTAPHTTPVGRLDEVQAARHPILKFSLDVVT
jgi:glycine dehydrogenase subunit 2